MHSYFNKSQYCTYFRILRHGLLSIVSPTWAFQEAVAQELQVDQEVGVLPVGEKGVVCMGCYTF